MNHPQQLQSESSKLCSPLRRNDALATEDAARTTNPTESFPLGFHQSTSAPTRMPVGSGRWQDRFGGRTTSTALIDDGSGAPIPKDLRVSRPADPQLLPGKAGGWRVRKPTLEARFR